MQTYHPDAADWYRSLDELYYFGGSIFGHAREHRAIYPHIAQRDIEVSLNVGDLISVAGNNWNGWSTGTNLRTKKTGLFPSYKVAGMARFS